MPSLSNVLTSALALNVQSKIKSGFVLCLDPDYLLLHYGDITVGRRLPESAIGSRYAVCVGEDGEATFWSLLSTSDSDYSVKIPDEAKSGPFTKNAKPSYFNPKQLWVMTREMAVESHIQVNGPLRGGFEYSRIAPSMVPEWPKLPPSYPKNFTRKDLRPSPIPLPSESIVINLPQEKAKAVSMAPVKVVHPLPANPIPLPTTPTETPMVKSAEPVFDQGAWVRSIREVKNVSRQHIADQSKNFIKPTLLARIERNNMHFTADRLETWMSILGVPATEPNLKLLTVRPGKAMTHRSPKFHKKRGAFTASAAPSNPTNYPVSLVPAPGSREDTIAGVVRMLSNKRLTDDEAKAFGETLKAEIVHLLLGE